MGHDAPKPLAPDGELTRQLATDVLTLDMASLSAKDIKQLENLIFDHLGVAYRGSTMPWGDALKKWLAPYQGSGRAAVIGTTLSTSAATAAFVNATAAHGLELDDTHDESVSHPGAPVIATALSVAAHHGLSGQAILPAIAAGYETIGRVGSATGAGNIIEKGFHPTSLFTCFGATATAAHLLKLNERELCHAWGLCLSMAGGSMQFSQETSGTTVKRLHGGYGALHGVMAAELAALGIDGPLQAFDGSYGLCRNFGDRPDASRLTKVNSQPLEIHRISFKPYPCCRLFHSTLDALSEATDQFSLPSEDIESIHVGGPAIMVSQHMIKRPASVMAAQYSLPYTLGAAFFYGPTSVDGFAEPAMSDPRILALADKVTAEVSKDMEERFPAQFGSWIVIKDKQGGIRRCEVLDSLGTPARPMSEDLLIEKFNTLNQAVGLKVDGSTVFDQVRKMKNGLSANDLLGPLCGQKVN